MMTDLLTFDTDTTPNNPQPQTSKRKNNPEQLRHALIMAAKNLMVQEGIGNLSMQKVADLAGVSKGGLFHHFKNKDDLLIAVIELFIAQLNTAIMAKIDDNDTSSGKFTKAYLQVAFTDEAIGIGSDWSGLIRAISADALLQTKWQAWLSQKQRQFAATDGEPRHIAIGYAIDGAWLDNNKAHDKQHLIAIYHELLGLL